MSDTTKDASTSHAVAIAQPHLPAPVYSGSQMAEAMGRYRELQTALDKAMPDQLMTIGKKTFRKKGYWRAVCRAFEINVEMRGEDMVTLPSGDWGYAVTYRATAPNGAWADGDGSCMASEKAVFKYEWGNGKRFKVLDADGDPVIDKAATKDNATLHNVRGHAHTRAKNRAISDLCGFGEVSGEEVNPDAYDDSRHSGHQERRPDTRQGAPRKGPSEAQKNRMFAIGRANGWAPEHIKAYLAETWHIASSDDLSRDQYNILCGDADKGIKGILETPPTLSGEVVP